MLTVDLPPEEAAELAEPLKAAGIDDIYNFPWLEKPEPKALERAEALLEDLGALHRPVGASLDDARGRTQGAPLRAIASSRIAAGLSSFRPFRASGSPVGAGGAVNVEG